MVCSWCIFGDAVIHRFVDLGVKGVQGFFQAMWEDTRTVDFSHLIVDGFVLHDILIVAGRALEC